MPSRQRYLSAWPNHTGITPDSISQLKRRIPIQSPTTLRAYRSHIELSACCTNPAVIIRIGEEILGTPLYYIINVDHLPRPGNLGEALALYTVYTKMNRYWEAHEVLESYWKESQGPKRRLIQGLIKAAAALAKAGEGLYTPALRIAEEAERLLGSSSGCVSEAVRRVYFYGGASLSDCVGKVIEKLGNKA